jgi:hypothetical protein
VTPSTRSAGETELRIIRPEPLESATGSAQPTELRIIRPEPLAIPTPSSPARPADSRYIPKESPGRPSQDAYQSIPTDKPGGRGRRR